MFSTLKFRRTLSAITIWIKRLPSGKTTLTRRAVSSGISPIGSGLSDIISLPRLHLLVIPFSKESLYLTTLIEQGSPTVSSCGRAAFGRDSNMEVESEELHLF